jgi:hypothetical protein
MDVKFLFNPELTEPKVIQPKVIIDEVNSNNGLHLLSHASTNLTKSKNEELLCPKCHQKKQKESKMCLKCYRRSKPKVNTGTKPSYAVLKSMVDTFGCLKTAKICNVCDRTIHRWIKKYEKSTSKK